MRPNQARPEPFTKDDHEALYWAIVDMLTAGIAIDEQRRARLKALASRLSEHVRHQELIGRTSSGTRRKIDLAERKDLLRQKLLTRLPAEEMGMWAIYGEGVRDGSQAILLAIVEGSYAEAIERALSEPDFVTEGMGGQIDRLGLDSEV